MFETVEVSWQNWKELELKILTTKMQPKLAMIDGHPHRRYWSGRVYDVNLDKSTTIQLHFENLTLSKYNSHNDILQTGM